MDTLNYTLSLPFDLNLTDDEQQIVCGWANVSKVDDEDYYDLDGDHFPIELMEEAAHNFMTNACWPGRALGEQHIKNEDGEIAVKGEIVESLIVDDATAKALQIGDPRRGWFIKAKIWDPTMWNDVKTGRFTGFSIGACVTLELDEYEETMKIAKSADGKPLATVNGKKRKVKSMWVREVSVVDRPANPESVITLAKAMEPETMNLEDKVKQLEATVEKQAKAQEEQAKAIAEAETRLAEVEKQRDEAAAKVAELEKAAKKPAEPTDEAKEIEKALGDNPLLKKVFDRVDATVAEQQAVIEKQAKTLETILEKQANAEALLFVGKELPNLPGTEEQKIALVKSLNQMDEQTREYQLNLLKSAQKAATNLMGEVGTSAVSDDEGTAVTVQKAAATFQQEFEKAKKDNPALTQGMFLATDKGQALYQQQLKAMGQL